MDTHEITIEESILWIDNKLFWDINSFRPSINDFFSKSKKAKIYFEEENLSGKKIKIPRVISIENISFVNIR